MYVQYLEKMSHEWQVQGVTRYGQGPLVNVVTGQLQTNLSLVVKPPRYHAVNLTEKVDQGQLGEKDDTLLVVAATNCTVLDLNGKINKTG